MRSFVTALSFAFTAALVVLPTTALARGGCYICQRGSEGGCEQCSYGDKDSQAARKACEKRGCKIGGTKSCSEASNVKSCSMPTQSEANQTASLDPDLSCRTN
jgi:hypothetical protein